MSPESIKTIAENELSQIFDNWRWEASSKVSKEPSSNNLKLTVSYSLLTPLHLFNFQLLKNELSEQIEGEVTVNNSNEFIIKNSKKEQKISCYTITSETNIKLNYQIDRILNISSDVDEMSRVTLQKNVFDMEKDFNKIRKIVNHSIHIKETVLN